MGTYDRKERVERSKKMVKVASFSMIALGILSILAPLAVGIGIPILLGSVMLIVGLSYEVLAMSTRGTGVSLWRFLVGAGFVIVGIFLLIHPRSGLLVLTIALALALFLEGVGEIASFLVVRGYRKSGLLAANAAASLLLAVLIWRGWPANSAWAIGTLLGVNLITSGLGPLILSPVAVEAPSA
jgi:uncharacterized membrane protein HdeD (DUF308 family)